MATYRENLGNEFRSSLRETFEERTGIFGQALQAKRKEEEQQKKTDAQVEQISASTTKLRSVGAALSSMEVGFIQISKNMQIIAKAMDAEVTLQKETDEALKKLNEIAEKKRALAKQVSDKKQRDLSRVNKQIDSVVKDQQKDESLFGNLLDLLDNIGRRGGRGGKPGGKPGGKGSRPPPRSTQPPRTPPQQPRTPPPAQQPRTPPPAQQPRAPTGGTPTRAPTTSRIPRIPAGVASVATKVVGAGAAAVGGAAVTAATTAYGVYQAGKVARETQLGKRLAEGEGKKAQTAFRQKDTQYGADISPESARAILDQPDSPGRRRDIQAFGGQQKLEKLAAQAKTPPAAKPRQQTTSAAPAAAPARAPAAAPVPAAAPAPTAAPAAAGSLPSLSSVTQVQPGVDLEGVTPELKKRVTAMAVAFKEQTGKKLIVTSGFRTNEKQKQLYDDWKAGKLKAPVVAEPFPPLGKGRKSSHMAGLAIDISSIGAMGINVLAGPRDKPTGWLEKFGLIRNVPGEDWHIQLSGTPPTPDNPVNPGQPLPVPTKDGKAAEVDTGKNEPISSTPSNVVMSGSGIPITTGSGGFLTSGEPSPPPATREKAGPGLGGTDVVENNIPKQASERGSFQSASAFYKALYPYAELASQKLGGKIPPSAILAQWAKETGGGKAISGRFNYAGIYNFGMFPNSDFVFTEEKFTQKQLDAFLSKPGNKDRLLKIYSSNDEEFPYEAKKGKKIGKFYSKEGDAVTKAAAEGKKWVTIKSPFASFANLKEFAEGYVRVLSNPRYKQVLEQTTAEGFARTAVASGYATANAASYGASVSELSASIEREKQAGFQAAPTVIVVNNTNTTVKKPGTQVARKEGMALVGA